MAAGVKDARNRGVAGSGTMKADELRRHLVAYGSVPRGYARCDAAHRDSPRQDRLNRGRGEAGVSGWGRESLGFAISRGGL